jgi:hypothetical protein
MAQLPDPIKHHARWPEPEVRYDRGAMKRSAVEQALPTWVAAVALCVAGFYPIDNPDTFGHLALGRQIVLLGHVPKLDSFSYFRAQPAPFINYEWLSDTLFYALYAAGGYLALNAAKLLLLAALAVLLIRIGRVRAGVSGAWLSSLVLLSALPGLRFRLSVRPHLFGLLFAALFMLGVLRILEAPQQARAKRWVIGLAFMHVLWVNLHGSHLFGIVLVLLGGACASLRAESRSALKPLALLLGLQLGACCISPYGPAIVSSALRHVFDPRYRDLIEEWRPWSPAQPIWYALVVVWQCVWLLLALRARDRTASSTFGFASALLLLLMAARSMRFIPDFVALSAPTIGAGLALQLGAITGPSRRIALGCALALSAAAAGFVCIQLPPERAFGAGESSAHRPVASGLWLAQHWPDARILAVMQDAWDLMFALPRAKFLIDGRAPFYGPEHIRRVQSSWGSSARMRALIDQTATDVVVLEPLVTEQQPALHMLQAASDFGLVSIEERHCMFARRGTRRSRLQASADLRVLQPGYRADWILASDADPAAISAELAQLPEHPNVTPYRDWVKGLLAVRTVARAEDHAGLRPARGPAEHAMLEVALDRLRSTDETLEIVPSVLAYHALLAIAVCELDEARAVLQRAHHENPSREILFADQELVLRSGDAAAVRKFIDQAETLPAAAGDPWLAALRAQLATPPLCAAELASRAQGVGSAR